VKIHPGDLLLRDVFGAPNLPADTRRALLDHLRACARCRERLRDFLHPQPSLLARKVAERLRRVARPAVLDRSVPRVEVRKAALARERSEAPALLERLLDQPLERRDLLIRNHPHYKTWSLAELILQKSAEEALRSSRPAEDLARLALRLIDHLDPGFYGTERLEDLKARSWARIGNALRIRAELAAAEAAFDQGFAHLRMGTGEPLEKATYLDLKASLLFAQRHLDEAEELQEQVIAIFLEAGETHLAGRALLSLGTTLSNWETSYWGTSPNPLKPAPPGLRVRIFAGCRDMALGEQSG
jgi:tetratricopeptide (TPR) repeat protein